MLRGQSGSKSTHGCLNQGVKVGISHNGQYQERPRLLPVIQFSKSTRQIQDFNPKSIKSGEIVGKVYNFKIEIFLNKIKRIKQKI